MRRGGEDDTIIFGTSSSSGLWHVPAGGGGTPEPLTTLDESQSESNHEWPELLPGGEAVLFTLRHTGDDADTAQIVVRHLGTGEQRVLVSGGSYPKYGPSGHLVYAFAGTLRAVPFDLDQLTVTGAPVGVVEGLVTKPSGAAEVDVAQNGSLIYVAGGGGGGILAPSRTLVWMDREGRETPLPLRPDNYSLARLSPDGVRVAVSIEGIDNVDIWSSELARGSLSKVTTDPSADRFPLWTPSSERVVFASNREGPVGLFSKAADGTGDVERLVTIEEADNIAPQSWSLDGKMLVFTYASAGSVDIGVLMMDGDRSWQPLMETEADETGSVIAPQGGWMAYDSDETGELEVYVQRFPDLGDKKLISTSGGRRPPLVPRRARAVLQQRLPGHGRAGPRDRANLSRGYTGDRVRGRTVYRSVRPALRGRFTRRRAVPHAHRRHLLAARSGASPRPKLA